VKRGLDVIGAASALVVLGPVLAIAIAAVALTMGLPVLYRDRRGGLHGVPFDLLKFRTMRPLRPGETIPDDDERRITRVGRFLRATSIDELPSFVNVLRGEMSLVGPRPLPLRYVDRYSRSEARRLEVRPGVTGWAQVNGRNDLGWAEKFELDTWYVDHRSVRLDLEIMWATVGKLVRREGIAHGDHATMPEFVGTAVCGDDSPPVSHT
jgi:lipopolysaccharide/colanic/teichoic acid biosynthesis glycosyltransferase